MVTPCAGVWIEILTGASFSDHLSVTPCAGVWIEIERLHKRAHNCFVSLPVRECGLK